MPCSGSAPLYGRKEQIMKHKKTAIYCGTLCILAFLFAVKPMLTSTYAAYPESMVYFLTGAVIPMMLLTVIAFKYTESTYSMHTVTLATVLTIGNAAALPLLQYTSSLDEKAIGIAKEISSNTIRMVIMIPVTWLIAAGLCWLGKQTALRQRIAAGAALLASLVYTALLFLIADPSSNTAVLLVGSHRIQAAIPALMLSILQLCLMTRIPGKLWRAMIAAGITLVNAGLILKGETGIPLILFASAAVWYYLLQPFKRKWLTFGIPLLSAAGCASVWILHRTHDSLPDVDWLRDMAGKIETRIFEDYVYQIDTAAYSLQTGGWFGAAGYNICLPEASSDMAVITILHYCGLLFLLVILAAAVPAFYFGTMQITRSGVKGVNALSSICLSVLFVSFFYNLLMCFGLVPVLGSQVAFTGFSAVFAAFSGLLLGALCPCPNFVKKAITDQLKGVYDTCEMQKQTVE